MKISRGQSMTEYILLMVIIIIVLLIFAGPGGFFDDSLNKAGEDALKGVKTMAEGVDYDGS